MHICQKCDAFGRERFCGECGARFFGPDRTWRECSKCKVEVSVPFCPLCGNEMAGQELERWERGDVDLEEEGRNAQSKIDRMVAGNDALDRALYDGDFDGLAVNRAKGLAGLINEGFGVHG